MEYNAYITIDNRLVESGNHQRGAQWHFESMQGSKYNPKIDACHFFAVSTAAHTEHFTASVNADGLDEERDNWFRNLASQVENQISSSLSEKDRAKLLHIGKPGEIEAFSSYQMHRSPKVDKDTNRTFLRLEFTKKTLETEGDSKNPLINKAPDL